MDTSEIILEGYREIFGNSDLKITALPGSGSDRKYFRIVAGGNTLIGAYNPVPEENEAFIGFTEHFAAKGLNVPEIYGYLPDKHIYFLGDLGDINLYKWLKGRPDISNFNEETKDLFRRILDHLILFQTIGVEGLNLDLCYPHRSFDRQSMMWDMNYFKYMLLKLLAVPFSEMELEHDFNSLADYLLEAGQDFFLYRDFQTANIMILDNEPWFIDYQGGRKGAAQYDLASLLYDAKIDMPEEDRDELMNYYIGRFCSLSMEDSESFTRYFNGFSMIRIVQALGAFGFRGLYEKKPTFTESIVPGVHILIKIIEEAENHLSLPEFYKTVKSIPGSQVFRDLYHKYFHA
jgi:aminoglycoside/choline kinase family phosphotransferase